MKLTKGLQEDVLINCGETEGCSWFAEQALQRRADPVPAARQQPSALASMHHWAQAVARHFLRRNNPRPAGARPAHDL